MYVFVSMRVCVCSSALLLGCQFECGAGDAAALVIVVVVASSSAAYAAHSSI